MLNDEDTQVRFVLEKLTRRHPEVAPQVLAEMVEQTRSTFADATVRSFVPLLIERRMTIELSSHATN